MIVNYDPIDFSVLKRTGLRQGGELDKLFGVTRVTVHAYFHGRTQPKGNQRAHAAMVVKVLETLLEKQKLPLPPEKDADARILAVRKISAYIKTLQTRHY